jgi:predicted nucleic acid-binding protein
MVICCDTSFLFSLYANDAHSARAVAWVRATSAPLHLSTLNEYEAANAFRFAEFRRAVPAGRAVAYWADLESDVAAGRLVVTPCNLAAVVAEAKRLSATHTLTGGHRSFDVLHVACALHLDASQFLTFDRNQKRLAEAERLTVPL